ncbi:hypothetical protein QFC21_003701 [Naganishia friedmannii]|uniref:Uncharacterized protein n=1 Tax=Naganishia friedmannii TaxID=89922 RepID=A0ACC2VNG6_9TREE|nr:hypothetical protein QFC21_003701 [Naganishia friedmannii]
MDNQHFRYGRRPGIRKSTTGSGHGGDSSSQTSNSTGYSLFYKPAQTSLQEPPAARPSSTQRPAFIPSMPPPAAVGMEQSIQGTMWKGRFRQRCIASSQRREGSDGMGDPAAEEDNEAEEAEHEEIFRRMIQKEQRKKAHRIAVSFEQEVGGSDPAVWEAEVREAEKIGVSLPEEDGMERGTPQKSVDAQWQYRSATKYQHFPPHARSSGNGKTASPAHQRTQAYRTSERDGVDDDEDTEEAAQYAAFLQAQADEDRLLAEYANDAAPTTYHAHTNPRQHPSAAAGEGGIGAATVGIEEQPAADTPGAELGIEMQGFTWEDAPLSDEDESGNGTQDVEMV